MDMSDNDITGLSMRKRLLPEPQVSEAVAAVWLAQEAFGSVAPDLV